MNVQFMNSYLENLFQGKAVSGKPKYSSDIVEKFKRTILKLQFADSLRELSNQRGLHFEALRGDYKGFFSVRVDKSYRLILSLKKEKRIQVAEVIMVHDLKNHYQ
jgi:proteic killer suppression protein